MAKSKKANGGAAEAGADDAPVEGALDQQAMRAVAAVAAPLGLVLFVLTATVSLVVAVFARDPDGAPAWLLGAVFSLAVWAVARDLRRGGPRPDAA